MTLFKLQLAKQYIAERTSHFAQKLAEKHQRSLACPMVGSATAPFDFIGDNLRSFTDCLIDIKRQPSKVLEALDVITDMLIKDLDKLPKPAPKGARVFSALHMPTFMSTKDFEKFWWPSFLKLSKAIVERGYIHLMFCEDNWNRFVDYLQDLPKGCIINFEYMDPKLAKDKLGKDHILAGFFPLNSFAKKSPAECIDEAKAVLDIMAPGGNYMFRTDKAPILKSDINIESYKAVVDYVMNNTDYY
jgi:uroporphyrinogen-III decarboxylase